MGFWGSLGKGLLKAAPIAANFIPGVGPLASMAIGAGTNALSNKLEGGSWKGALGNAALGAGMGYLGSKLPGAGGVGPTSSMRDKLINAGQQGLGMMRKRASDPGGSTGRAIDRPTGQLPPTLPGGGIGPGGIPPGGGGGIEIPDQPNLDILSRMRGQTPQDFVPNLDYMNPRRPMGQFNAPTLENQGIAPTQMPPPAMAGIGRRPSAGARRTGSARPRPSVY